ncbi:RagB/SusD family nutrient uptake outer membrane protein [Dyadobacter chenhuakuii]|uniref:RagB/SusD family nutrient uptake outer membrane protein n=1 Tax=Dyadobacter chenhuakuii TaxID=2909339 RepID=A0A9X1TSR7_9BACT|nr:RagB/SusD family nutrient uptake outer membrane protein [Dyadobacter chenhuakuii]MCF2497212.1 RagB/SusD family nutrient uptake outer membrane protein [Dyadobacter chenhuakuii]
MKKIFLLTSFILMVATACNRDFDQPNPNNPTIASFWKSQNDAIKGINAVYSTFHRTATLYSRFLFYHGMLRSDEGYGSGGDITLNNVMSFNQTNYNEGLTAGTWQNLFVGVFRANQVLAYVPGIEMDEALKTRIIGEAKFLRSLFYFNLTLYYGRPPIILEPSSPTDRPTNATNAEAWAQVERDLMEAAPALPLRYTGDDLGRATRGAAMGLLGKAYLQQNKYQEAANALAWFITGEGKGVYTLVANYQDNFKASTENNSESIFEIQFRFNPNENTDDDVDETRINNTGTSIARFYGPPGGDFGFSDGAARRWVVNEFHKEKTATNERDPRLAATFLFDSTDVRGPAFTQVYGQTFAQRYGSTGLKSMVWFRKQLNDNEQGRTEERFSSPNNHRLLRYADVLLMYAEALNGIGQTVQAYPYVDQVRARAGLRPLSVVMPGLSKDAFLAQLKHERITELSGETWRFADLQRWGDLGPQLASRDPEFTNFVKGRNEWYPIPQSDIDLNPNLTQNPRY